MESIPFIYFKPFIPFIDSMESMNTAWKTTEIVCINYRYIYLPGNYSYLMLYKIWNLEKIENKFEKPKTL